MILSKHHANSAFTEREEYSSNVLHKTVYLQFYPAYKNVDRAWTAKKTVSRTAALNNA